MSDDYLNKPLSLGGNFGGAPGMKESCNQIWIID